MSRKGHTTASGRPREFDVEKALRRAMYVFWLKGYLGASLSELTEAMVADVLWSMNSPEFYLLLVAQRGWSPAEFGRWLADAWIRLLL